MKTILALILSVTLFGAYTQAHLIQPPQSAPGNDSVSSIEANLGVSPLVLLYKIDFGDPNQTPPKLFEEDGVLSNAFFSITNIDFNDPGATATIAWNLTGSGYALLGVAWKAGNSYLWAATHPSQHYMSSAPEMLVFPEQKDGSHISFYGQRSVRVPDSGATLCLLGAAIGLLIVARRFRK